MTKSYSLKTDESKFNFLSLLNRDNREGFTPVSLQQTCSPYSYLKKIGYLLHVNSKPSVCKCTV